MRPPNADPGQLGRVSKQRIHAGRRRIRQSFDDLSTPRKVLGTVSAQHPGSENEPDQNGRVMQGGAMPRYARITSARALKSIFE